MKLLPALAAFALAAAASAADWPQWMGPKRDGRAAAGAWTATTLPDAAKPAWQMPIGGGFSYQW